MLTIAAPDAVETRCNSCFESLMWAMARPGMARTLPAPGLSGLIETLIDLECTVFAGDEALRGEIAATGATLVGSLADADHVFIANTDGAENQLATLRCGSALYPDDGATLATEVRYGSGQRVRLSGPGIEHTIEMALGLSAQFWAMRQTLCLYPEGFDLLLVDGDAVIGIPRSTQVEVL